MFSSTSHRAIRVDRSRTDAHVLRPVIWAALVLLAVATMLLAHAVGSAVATIERKPAHVTILGCHLDRDPATGVVTRSHCDD